MRRLILIALCLLLPLKALAAVVVPIAGLPGLAADIRADIRADTRAAMASSSYEMDATPHCVFMAAQPMEAAPADSPAPDHPCPHLAMATVSSHLALALSSDDPVATPRFTPHEFVSVVLDVPLQPPSA